MKLLVPVAVAVAALSASAVAQVRPGGGQGRLAPAPQPTYRGVQVPALPGFRIGYSARQGTTQIVEMVPNGQTVHRYTKIVTLNTFRSRPGVSDVQLTATFTTTYRKGCPRAAVAPILLRGGYSGIRVDCPRNLLTGKPETVFLRVIQEDGSGALVQYMTTYFTMPAEAAQAREFLGRAELR